MSAAQQETPNIAVTKLERDVKRSRREFNKADAALLRARADHRMEPSHRTLEAVDLAERDRNTARRDWLRAVDALEIAQTGEGR